MEDTDQASEPLSDMTEIVELSDQELKTTMTNMLRALMNKSDCLLDQISNVSRDMEILRKNQKEMLEENRNTVTEINHVFVGLSSRLDTAKERISELEDTSAETFKTERDQEKNQNKTKLKTKTENTV